MTRPFFLGMLAALTLSACAVPQTTQRFRTTVMEDGRSYPVQCNREFGLPNAAVTEPVAYASCNVTVEEGSYRCRAILAPGPVAAAGMQRDWTPTLDQIDAACDGAIRVGLIVRGEDAE